MVFYERARGVRVLRVEDEEILALIAGPRQHLSIRYIQHPRRSLQRDRLS